MKSYILIFIGLFLCCCSIKKGNSEQKTFEPLLNYKGDTALYIKENFIYKKEYYIGSEINLLLNKLGLPIVKYNAGITPDLKEYYYISIQFLSDLDKNRKIKEKKDPVIMNIFLEKPVQATAFRYLAKSSGQKWTKEVVEFWGTQKI